MSTRRCILVLGMAIGLASLAEAQTPRFYWDPVQYDEDGHVLLDANGDVVGKGGMVDSETGMVWGINVTVATRPTYTTFTWDRAMTLTPGLYAASEWGYPYTDWRLPSASELQFAANSGLHAAYVAEFGDLADHGYGMQYPFWTSTTRAKSAYAMALTEAEPWLTFKVSGLCVLLCRGVAAAPTKPPKK